MKKKIILFLLFLVYFLSRSLFVFAYRPFATEDAGVSGKKVFQLEISYDYLTWDNQDKENVFLFVPIYGLSEKIELSLEIPYLFHHPALEEKKNGLGDINLVGKFLLFAEKEKIPALTLKTVMKTDSGNQEEGLGSGERDYGFLLTATKGWENFTLHTMLGYTFVGKGDDGNIRNIHLFGLGIDYSLNKKISLVSEISGQRHPDRTSTNNPLGLLFGFLYKKSEKMIFDFGLRKGLNQAVPKINLTFGCSLSF